MENSTSFSQINAVDRFELERIMKMKNPHSVMKERNSAKGFLAIWRRPPTISNANKARPNDTSINGINKYVFKIYSLSL